MKSIKHSRPRVLLVNTNRMRPAVAPLGLDLLADALKKSGFVPVPLDLAWEKAPLAALQNAVKKHAPLAVGISVRNLDDCYFASRSFLLPPLKRYVQAIKEASKAPVVLGGVGFSVAPAAALSYLGADLGLRGDGEEAFPLLLERLAAGGNLDHVPGLALPGRPSPPPARAKNYGAETPRRGTFDLARYFRLGGQGNLDTQRGCNRKCIYCADPVAKGRKPRNRHPESVAQEMAALVEMGVHTFHFCDSEFNLSRAHAEAVALAIIKQGIASRVRWYAYALPSPMDDDLARLLARAGCAGIDFSVDAASEEMLAALGRDFSIEDLEKCARAMRKAGITFMYDLLLGGPGETRKTMAATIRRIKKIRPHRVGVSFGVRVFPHTALARMALKAGPLEENPELHGNKRNNPGLLKPVFFVSEKLGPEPEEYLKKLVDDDPIFFFATRRDWKRNYNYNNNRPLCRAIRKGARGAYWDILRKMASES